MKISKKLITLGLSLTTVMAIGLSDINADSSFYRYQGKNRALTALKTTGVETAFSKGDNFVIADGYSFADSLSAMNIANKFNAKLLLDANYNFSKTEIEGALDKFKPKNVYLVGGKISQKYSENKYKDTNIIRVYGKNRYDTNRKTLKVAGYSDVGVASGENYADALSSYSLLREKGLGLLLVKPQENYNTDNLNVKYTFGGKSSVKKDNGTRFSGSNRYDTSIKIAENTGAKNIIFVSGNNFADALSSVNIVNQKGGDILLTPSNGDKRVVNLCKNADKIFAVGGQSALSDKSIQSAIEGKKFNEPKVVPMKKNISGYNLGFIEYNDLNNLISTVRVDYLTPNDLAFTMKSPEKGYLFTIYVVDNFVESSSEGMHERNIGTLTQNGKKHSVFLNIGSQPNYSNEYNYYNALNKVMDKIERGAIVGTDGSSFQLNKAYFNEMRNTFVKKVNKPVNKPAVKKNYITVPGTNGKVRINLPSNVASRIEILSDGTVINKATYNRTGNLDESTIILIYLQDYVGTNRDYHNFAESNTYGTFIKNGKKYSLAGDYSFTTFRYNSDGILTDNEVANMRVDQNAILYALQSHNVTGLIH